jgi:hypothetical protein
MNVNVMLLDPWPVEMEVTKQKKSDYAKHNLKNTTLSKQPALRSFIGSKGSLKGGNVI